MLVQRKDRKKITAHVCRVTDPVANQLGTFFPSNAATSDTTLVFPIAPKQNRTESQYSFNTQDFI